MDRRKIIGLIGAVGICLGAVFSVELRSISDQSKRLQSAADHAALSAERYASDPELWAYTVAAKQQLSEQFGDLDFTIEDELSDEFVYTIRLSTPVNFKISSFGILPKTIQKQATIGPSMAQKTRQDIDEILPKTNFGTRTIMNLHGDRGASRFHISENQERLSLSEILEIAENTYFEQRGEHKASRWDVIVIATDKPIDAVSCEMISERKTSVIIHPYGPKAKENQKSCPENMIYCCGHKIIRWNFTTDLTRLNANISEILEGLEHLHITC